ncbi:MAG TPA: sigma-70 family RNA polymerase sigma factor [Solirubrobacteraceae bacterium]|jgi:RNA polymerase sigma factor (sigma-70 family)|nr:sigma-70 family RNA polymerase sigma factor [Solirubrobacteraceae bacterium]
MSPSISVRLLLTQSDASLMEYARLGHERAFEALVHRYRRQLHAYCRRLLLSDERAEDALQQALLQAWLALRDGAEVWDVRPWLYRIVHNVAVSALRSSAYDYCTLNESLSGADAPQADLDRRIAVREALAGLAALPAMQREALLRTAVEGRSHHQVASDLGVSEPALRGLVYRARATLRAAAGAIVPPPLLDWALQAGTQGGPTLEGLAASSGGIAGLTGLLVKGGAVAATAGALASGIVAAHSHRGAANAHLARVREPRATSHGAPAIASPWRQAAPALTIAQLGRVAGSVGEPLAHRRDVANTAAPSGTRTTTTLAAHDHPSGVANSAPGHLRNDAWQHGGSQPPQRRDVHPSVGDRRFPAAAAEHDGGSSGRGDITKTTGTSRAGGDGNGVSGSGDGRGEHRGARISGEDQASSQRSSSGMAAGEGDGQKNGGASASNEADGTTASHTPSGPLRDERSLAAGEPAPD